MKLQLFNEKGGESPVGVSSIYPPDIFRESLLMILLLLSTIFVVYKTPKPLGYLFVAVLVYMFWKSDREYFFFAYLFIILCCPGNFFTESTFAAPRRLALFTIARGFSFTTHEVFMLVALFKAYKSRRKFRSWFIKPMKFLGIYAVFLLALSFLLFGTSFKTLVTFSRNILFYSYFVSLPLLIKDEEEVGKFLWLQFPAIFLSFLSALYFYKTNRYLANLVNPDLVVQLEFLLGDQARYVMHGGEHILVLSCFIFALFLSISNRLKSIYLNLIALLAFLSILFTATRVWFVVYSLILIVFFLKSKKIGKIIISTGIFILLLALINTVYPVLGAKSQQSTERLLTVFSIGDEDSAASTQIDYKKQHRMPKVLDGISKSPVVGWGFSDVAAHIADQDVGNFALLAQVGFLGFFLFFYLWFTYFRLIAKTRRMLRRKNPFKNSLSFLSACLIGLLLAHFTTHQFFGFSLASNYFFFTAMFIYLSEFYMKEALKLEERL